jgi:hypothetical protein
MQGKPGAEAEEFAKQAAGARRGIVAEFGDFLMQNKKWWLAPILIAIALLGGLAFLGGTGAAPFIYTLF